MVVAHTALLLDEHPFERNMQCRVCVLSLELTPDCSLQLSAIINALFGLSASQLANLLVGSKNRSER
jgi:hypothetical protein